MIFLVFVIVKCYNIVRIVTTERKEMNSTSSRPDIIDRMTAGRYFTPLIAAFVSAVVLMETSIFMGWPHIATGYVVVAATIVGCVTDAVIRVVRKMFLGSGR
ncbi:MAG: hypothetical protein WAU02_00325 [Candidatus Saccharimonadales bacterium]